MHIVLVILLNYNDTSIDDAVFEEIRHFNTETPKITHTEYVT